MTTPSRCPCGREAVWSFVVADTGAEDFRIRPDLCHACYLRLPPGERAGWRRAAATGLRTHRDELALSPETGGGSRPYLLGVEGRAVFVSVAVDAPNSENPTGALTPDIMRHVTLLTQRRLADERERSETTERLPPQPRASVQVADTSAPFQMAVLTDEQARRLLAPEDFDALMQVLERQRRNT